MITAILLGFVFAALVPLLSKLSKNNIPFIFSLIPIGVFIYFLNFIGDLGSTGYILERNSWIPSMGIDLDFRIDGLSLFFGLLITGIGSLVFIYTSYYLKDHEYLDRFYGYLSMFMGAMLGLVFSDNLITMFIFWELTSISSFFLIGFNNEDDSSRKSALTALSITGLGGLFLLGGMILIGMTAETYSFTEIMGSGDLLLNSPYYSLILFFVFIGAFTKSAQFPFHFWLPGAMKAPTPVSTYLHSATMVKAGIFLLARFSPVLGGTSTWEYTLIIVGGITLLYASIHSLFRVDLKGILAYSTIAALGMLVFLIGLGSEKALLAAGLFILAHALYKAALFLITGIIDHETGTRDITKLSGLGKVMKPVAIAGFIAALSSAGFPLFLGFISKEVMYEAALKHESLGFFLLSILFISKVLLLVAGFWTGIKPFIGELPSNYQGLRLPSPRLWMPPLVLGLLTVILGIFPFLLEENLFGPLTSSLTGKEVDIHLSIWHGFNFVLVLSAFTLVFGIILYFYWIPSAKKLDKTIRFSALSPETLSKKAGKLFQNFALAWTLFFQNGYLRNYVITILSVLVLMVGYRLFSGVAIYLDWSKISEITTSEVVVVLLMVTSIFFVVLSTSRTAAIVALGVIGFANCLFFLYYSAPDLAMTQFSIDTLTVLLFMLVLYKLPKNRNFSSLKTRLRDGILSLAFGVLIAVFTLEVFEEPNRKEISQYYADNAYILAKGKNVVNVILVDFRGFDTMIETVVLVIAAIGVFSLMYLNLQPSKKD